MGRSQRRLTTQTVHGLRNAVQASDDRRCAGFTLIELMMVLVVLSIAGAVAFAGFRLDEFASQKRRFIDDVKGVIIQARNLAIDQQRPVTVRVDATHVRVTMLNPVTNVMQIVDAAYLGGSSTELLTHEQRLCIFGLQSGIEAPEHAQDIPPPTACVAHEQRLRFEPDGSFTDPDNTFSTIPNAGASLWIGDRSVSGSVSLTVIQIFPGGLIRSFEDLQE